MELASYIHAAWAYEEAHQGSSAVDFDVDKDVDLPDFFKVINLPKTWQIRIVALIAIANIIVIHTAPAIAYAPESSVNMAPWCNNLYLCDTSYMLEVQRLLARRGYGITIDGVYGRQTKQAIIDFQKTQPNLKADGIPGQQTIALLRGTMPPITRTSPQNPAIPPNPPLSPPISPPITVRPNPANSGLAQGINDPMRSPISEVGNLQILLKQRGFYEGEVDGVIGRSTTAAIVKAQQAYGLTADGFAGPLTMRALLAGGTNVPLAQPAFNQIPQPEEVAKIQKLLQDRGFYEGALDGFYGARTKSSILKAQLAYGQTATGELTPALLNALQSQVLRSPITTATNPNPSAPTSPPQSNNPANPPPIPTPNTNVPSANLPANSPNINVNFNISPRLTPNIVPPVVINGNNANGQAPVSGQNTPI